jgi:hypothetical protein
MTIRPRESEIGLRASQQKEAETRFTPAPREGTTEGAPMVVASAVGHAAMQPVFSLPSYTLSPVPSYQAYMQQLGSQGKDPPVHEPGKLD